MTIAVHDDKHGIGRHDNHSGDVGIKICSINGAGIAVERPVYFNYSGNIDGGHNVLGAAEPRKEWYFAEGCTRQGFDTYLCIINPEKRYAVAKIDYYLGNGIKEKRRGIIVRGKSRMTIPVHESGLGTGRQSEQAGDVSIRIRSTNGVGIVVERPIYFDYGPFWFGAHCVVGAEKPSEKWFFAEGCTRHGFDTYLCLMNSQGKPSEIALTYYRSDGSIERKQARVEPFSGKTISVHGDKEGAGRGAGVRGDIGIGVRSINGTGIVAERPVYFAPRWRTVDKIALAGARGGGEVIHGQPERKCVCLTFDAESSGDVTALVLNILEAKNANATFFVTGGFPGNYPEAIKGIANEGHEIANHSMTHAQFTRISASRISWELSSTDSAVQQATGFSTKPYFRFPYGDRNSSLVRLVNSLGYLSIYWTIDPQEWRSGKSPSAVASHIVSKAEDGAIILMHDRANTVHALPVAIDGLRTRGFEIVTLSEVFLSAW